MCNESWEAFCNRVSVFVDFGAVIRERNYLLQFAVPKGLVRLRTVATQLGYLFELHFDRISAEMVLDS
jgi:hypothetical protein